MRRALDWMYQLSLWLAGACIGTIAGLVLMQVGGRLLDRILLALDLPRTGFAIPSLAEFGAFLFVAGSFLALAGTFKDGAHIRVALMTNFIGKRMSRAADLISLLICAALAVFASWHSWLQMWDSYVFGSVSFGVIKIPLAIPQATMAFGFTLLTIAIFDEFFTVIRQGKLSFAGKAEKAGAH